MINLKSFNELNTSEPDYVNILKEKFVDVFNDLVDLFVDEVDNIIDEYDRDDIYIIANLVLVIDNSFIELIKKKGFEESILNIDDEFDLFYTSTKENNKILIKVEDIIKIDYPKDPVVNNILNNKDILEKVLFRIDFALTAGYNDDMRMIPCNYTYIMDKMKKLYGEFEFDMMDPYSFY